MTSSQTTRAKTIVATILLLPLALFAVKQFLRPSPLHTLPIIAITQIVEHPALDAERAGVNLALNKAGYIDGKNIKIVYQCAQGSQATAVQIAQQFAGLAPKVVVAISTPSAQAALAPCKESGIPMVFAAITDPLAAKLVTRLGPREEAVTGVQDFVPIAERINFMISTIPNLKRIGVIYNSGEVNSSTIVKLMKIYVQGKEANIKDMEIVEATANRSSDIPVALNSLLGKIDVLYIPNDNTAVSGISTIVQWGKDHKVPILTSDTSLMDTGILATNGYSHMQMGEFAGNQVVQILNGTFAGYLPVQTEHEIETVVNHDVAKKLGMYPN
jgi:putative ABC transport system substrate-binding protein